ncbi:MAG: magnesium transporter [Sedimentisphaerales bacterium]|jgi:magnesium transporter|nr:magnesium transporter [Sedimentisphaerales bacterium]HNY77433.1 magnesium transporter [Sedimentisphaerales bacterium]HOC62837.1 magnesium transporter [Sedimentisphaerales bacterium]HOH63677.1 magnesium transporter [Sedimentisphaerales bacterium]HPY51468.1 magnesium transporter [Sedimentisphaerales bacterium]
MTELREQLLREIEPLLESENRATLRELLYDWRTSDISEIVELVDDDRRRLFFDVLETPVAAEVMEKVNEATRARLFEVLKEEELQRIFSEMDWDDAADLLAEMPEEVADKVLHSLSQTDRLQIHKLMRYSADSAGGIMDPLVISVPKDATIAEAVSKIRMAAIEEDFYSICVLDQDGRFIGDVRIRLLLTRPENTRVGDLVDPDAIYVRTDTDQEEVRNIFSKNNLIVVPVLDADHKLVGRITADRVIEVAEEEAAEDVYTMAGTDADELETFSAARAARIRMTWLLPCLLGTGVTATVMSLFGAHYQPVYLAAAAFVPMIAAISGNAGLQTSAIVVSGLATGHLAALKLSTVFTREVRIALLVALSCGIVGAVICSILIHYRPAQHTIEPVQLVFAFGTAMFSAIMVATTLGLVLPFLFRRIGIDPAISSGPLVTTANDSISVAIYMALAVTLAR